MPSATAFEDFAEPPPAEAARPRRFDRRRGAAPLLPTEVANTGGAGEVDLPLVPVDDVAAGVLVVEAYLAHEGGKSRG